MRCFRWPVRKSHILVKDHVGSKSYVAFEVTVACATSQDYQCSVENTNEFVDHPIPKDPVPAHGASHYAWSQAPHHLNPALRSRKNAPRLTVTEILSVLISNYRQWWRHIQKPIVNVMRYAFSSSNDSIVPKLWSFIFWLNARSTRIFSKQKNRLFHGYSYMQQASKC